MAARTCIQSHQLSMHTRYADSMAAIKDTQCQVWGGAPYMSKDQGRDNLA